MIMMMITLNPKGVCSSRWTSNKGKRTGSISFLQSRRKQLVKLRRLEFLFLGHYRKNTLRHWYYKNSGMDTSLCHGWCRRNPGTNNSGIYPGWCRNLGRSFRSSSYKYRYRSRYSRWDGSTATTCTFEEEQQNFELDKKSIEFMIDISTNHFTVHKKEIKTHLLVSGRIQTVQGYIVVCSRWMILSLMIVSRMRVGFIYGVLSRYVDHPSIPLSHFEKQLIM